MEYLEIAFIKLLSRGWLNQIFGVAPDTSISQQILVVTK
jgi:hypothetical protein